MFQENPRWLGINYSWWSFLLYYGEHILILGFFENLNQGLSMNVWLYQANIPYFFVYRLHLHVHVFSQKICVKLGAAIMLYKSKVFQLMGKIQKLLYFVWFE